MLNIGFREPKTAEKFVDKGLCLPPSTCVAQAPPPPPGSRVAMDAGAPTEAEEAEGSAEPPRPRKEDIIEDVGFLSCACWSRAIGDGSLVCCGSGPAEEPKIVAMEEKAPPPLPPKLAVVSPGSCVAMGEPPPSVVITAEPPPGRAGAAPGAGPPNIVDIMPEAMADSPQYIAGALLGELGSNRRSLRSSAPSSAGGIGDIGQSPPPAAGCGAASPAWPGAAGAAVELPMATGGALVSEWRQEGANATRPS